MKANQVSAFVNQINSTGRGHAISVRGVITLNFFDQKASIHVKNGDRKTGDQEPFITIDLPNGTVWNGSIRDLQSKLY